jgi:hypothetical protein
MIDNNLKSKLYGSIRDNRTEHPYEYWHASSLSACPRAHYYKRLQVPPVNVPGAGKMLRWDGGHAVETAIRPHIQNIFPESKDNVRFVSEKYQLTGEYDNYDPESRALIEIKSVHDGAFKVKTTGGVKEVALKEQIGTWPNGNIKWGLKQESYVHYQMQQHALILLMAEQDIEVKDIYYVYISLGGQMVVYKEQPSDVMMAEVERRLRLLNEAWETSTAPDCICHEEDHPFYHTTMKWCEYLDDNECCSLDLINEKIIKEDI